MEREINTTDMNARMRDLENKFLDFKSNFEKRVLIMLEENPQKYLRHLKVMEDKDSALWKDSYQKQNKMEEDLRSMRDIYQKQNEAFFNKILGLEAQIQDCQYKIKSNPIPELNETNIFAIDSKEYNGNMVVYDKKAAAYNLNSTGSNTMEIEFKLLKEGFFQEQNRRDTLYQDVMNLYKDLNSMVHKHEHEIIQKFKQQKEEISLETNASKDQLKKIETFKTDSFNNETSIVKNMINSLEKRIQEEIDRRMVLEYEIKRLVDDKMGGFKDENVRNEKNFLENEQKYMKQIQESFTSLSQIIKSNKDQLEADMASTQTMTNENFKTLSKTMDFLRETMTGKLIIVDTAIKEQSMTLNGVVTDNNKKIEDFHKGITKELERNEKVIGVFEMELNKVLKETENKFEGNVKNLEDWKKKFEGKTQGILKEMSGMLRGVKEDMVIDKNEKNEKLRQIIKEQESISKMNEDLLNNMKIKMENLNESFEYKLKEMMINWQAVNMLNEQKIKDSMEDVKKACNEKMEKNLIENIYNLNQKLTLEFKKDLQNTQEINKAIIEENRQKILTDLAYNDKKTESLLNKAKEEFTYKNNTNIKQIQGITEDLRSHKEENKENIRKVKLELEGSNEKLENKFDNKIISSALDVKEQLNHAIIQQNKDFQTNLTKNAQDSALNLKTLEQKMQKELENSGSSMQNNLKEEMLQESNRINEKFKGIDQVIDINKRMLLEAVSQNAESTKALCRALILEESARREKALDDLLKLMKKSLDSLELLLNNKMEKLSDELHLALKEKADELEKNMLDLERKVNKDLKEMRENNERWFNEICVELYLEKNLRKQREFEYDETMKNVEIRFMDLEDALFKFKAKIEGNNKEIISQIEGNRAILMENHQLMMDYQKVLMDHEEGLGLIEEKIEEIDNNQNDSEENVRKIQQELKDHNGRLEILKEDVIENKGMINKANEDLVTQGEKIDMKNKEIDEKFNENDEKIKEILKEIDDKFREKDQKNEEKTREILKEIDEKLIEKEQKNDEKIKEILKEIDEKFMKSDEKVAEIMETLTKDQKGIEILQSEVKKIDDELNNNNANMYEMDDKFSKYIEKVYLDMESRNYLNDLYNQIQKDEESYNDNYLKAKINKTSYQITKIMEKIEESDKIFDQFEVKTDNNFQIAEKAIKSHTRFLNELDARLTIEELYNKVCHRGAEESLKRSVNIINSQIESMSNQQMENNNGSLKGQLETVQEMRDLEEKTKENQEKIMELQEENQNLFKAVKAHGNFLNEIDAQMVYLRKFR